TIRGMVIDQPAGLHMGIHDRAADEAEPAPLEIATEGIGFAGGRRDLPERPPTIDPGFSADKTPDIFIEAAEFLLHGEKCACIADGGLHLQAIADDAVELQQTLDP